MYMYSIKMNMYSISKWMYSIMEWKHSIMKYNEIENYDFISKDTLNQKIILDWKLCSNLHKIYKSFLI